ncbi:hypothetical protein HNQ60_000634 [Povalibacter uvarum]|uniref:DUF1674 domain-containing protein n=1 Tax=Povalibacter uvarum TaxID=732238 RepID=A0A841HHP6_9GAMM|nr:DUF1674 domain-containing protein [Povalibacter uvarum]MBB6091788.1 hypothetical protein [Povalibacter uvarum]
MPSSRQESPSNVATTPVTDAGATPVSHIAAQPVAEHAAAPIEIGGREGPEPTRFGDWEKRGRCIDF